MASRVLDGGLTDEAGDERGAIDFDEMAFIEITEPGENFAHEPGDGRLARAGIAEEDAVQGGRRSPEPMTAPRTVGFQHIDQLAHFRFHFGEADERVEFGKNIWQRPDSRRAANVRRSEHGALGFSPPQPPAGNADAPHQDNAGIGLKQQQQTAKQRESDHDAKHAPEQSLHRAVAIHAPTGAL